MAAAAGLDKALYSAGTVKLTDLVPTQRVAPLPKLSILRSTDDRPRLQNPRILP